MELGTDIPSTATVFCRLEVVLVVVEVAEVCKWLALVVEVKVD